MAFLTSRIDRLSGNQMRESARSYDNSHLSSRSYDSSMTSVSDLNSSEFFDNVYLLDAAREEKVKYTATSEVQTSIEPAIDIESEKHYPLTRDNVKYAKKPEDQTDLVPPLDLKSEENYPTPRDYTFSYRKHCEADKVVLKPDKAFETWLSAKRKLLSDEAARRRKEKEMKQKEIEERKRLAKEKYDRWLQKKSQSSATLPSISNHDAKANTNYEIPANPKPSAEEVRARLEEWERVKRIKEEQRRILKRQEEQHRRELKEQRRQMAAEAWENWVSNADKKPKPVPLNRGIFTLRGTVSDIFVNPNEWKSIIPVENEEI